MLMYKGKMLVPRRVATFNQAMLVFASAVLFVSSTEEKAAALEKVNCNISYSSQSDILKYNGDEDKVEDLEWRRYHLLSRLVFELTCTFTFQCPIGCQCDLAATNINIKCPHGTSIVDVEYPSGYLSSSSYLPEENKDPRSFAGLNLYLANFSFLSSISKISRLLYHFSFSNSVENWLYLFNGDLFDSSSNLFDRQITVYSLYNTGLNSITQGAFEHLGLIGDCYLI